MTPKPKKRQNDVEALLEGVLEQDGVTMASPEGVGRRAKRLKKRRASAAKGPSIFFGDAPAAAEDRVAELDRAAIACAVKTVEGARERMLAIHGVERPRSAFVLSLRGCLSGPAPSQTDERLFSRETRVSGPAPDVSTQDAAVYGTLTQDLWIDASDPHALSGQFTPRDFRSAYRSAYGRFGRIRAFAVGIASDAASLFQRVERVERRAADEARGTLSVIEVHRFSPVRALIGFAATLLVVTLPANAVVLVRSVSQTTAAAEGAGSRALGELMAAKDAGSIPSSVESLKRASAQFRQADAVLVESRALALGLASVVPERYRTARALLEVGDKTSEAARLLALGFEKIFSDPSRRLDERLDVLAAYARGVLPLLTDAVKAAGDVNVKNLPAEKREEFTTLASRLDQAAASVREFAGLADLLSNLAGKDHRHTYLLVFQNQTEIRPTGGFMGSVAEITMDRGAIKTLRVPPGGTYDLKGQLLAHVISPAPLRLINAHWQFQDANWSPDFPTAASKIRWFWSKSGQPTLDGIIAVNASFMEKVLDVTGPIDMPAYGKVIDRSNFLLETQKAVEVEYDKQANTPKKFIGDLALALKERASRFTQEDWMKVAMLVSESLSAKDVQIALFDPDEEAVAERYGWSGRMKPTTGDSLAVVEANIAGQKTDAVIAETVEHVADIRADGSIVDRVVLTRTHAGTKGEMFRGVRNVTYVRIYVPLGSELLDASGFNPPNPALFKTPDDDYVPDADVALVESKTRTLPNGVDVSVEGDRTVFGGWLQLDPGKTQNVTLRYRLPFTAADLRSRLDASPESGSAEPADPSRGAYSLLLTSQSGKTERRVTSTVLIPGDWRIEWARGATSQSARSACVSGAWDRDRVLAALVAAPSAQPKDHVEETTQTPPTQVR